MQSCHPRGQIIPFTQYDLGAISPSIPRRTWMAAKTRPVGHFSCLEIISPRQKESVRARARAIPEADWSSVLRANAKSKALGERILSWPKRRSEWRSKSDMFKRRIKIRDNNISSPPSTPPPPPRPSLGNTWNRGFTAAGAFARLRTRGASFYEDETF